MSLSARFLPVAIAAMVATACASANTQRESRPACRYPTSVLVRNESGGEVDVFMRRAGEMAERLVGTAGPGSTTLTLPPGDGRPTFFSRATSTGQWTGSGSAVRPGRVALTAVCE